MIDTTVPGVDLREHALDLRIVRVIARYADHVRREVSVGDRSAGRVHDRSGFRHADGNAATDAAAPARHERYGVRERHDDTSTILAT